MFNNISWQSYGLSIALISAGYYLVVYLLYIRNDFKILIGRKTTTGFFRSRGNSLPLQKREERSASLNDATDFEAPGANTEEAIVYACIDELDAFFNESKKGKCLKEEMVFALQAILKKYPSLKQSGYKASLTNVMVGQCENTCSIHLDADDLVKVWFGG